nr:ATP synthase subunit beta, mitochondrial-like [Tanacetum cinerariifolium]
MSSRRLLATLLCSSLHRSTPRSPISHSSRATRAAQTPAPFVSRATTYSTSASASAASPPSSSSVAPPVSKSYDRKFSDEFTRAGNPSASSCGDCFLVFLGGDTSPVGLVVSLGDKSGSDCEFAMSSRSLVLLCLYDNCKCFEKITRLVPSCFAIFDLEPLSLAFDFVISSENSKSLSFILDRLCHLAILCLDQHAHTLHHLESLLIISLDRLDILKEDLVYQSLRKSLSLCLCFLDA